MNTEKLNKWFWESVVIGAIWLASDSLSIWIDKQEWRYVHGHFVLLLWISAYCKEVLFKK